MLADAYDSFLSPFNGKLPEWNEVVLALDFCKFGIQGDVYAETGSSKRREKVAPGTVAASLRLSKVLRVFS